MAIFKPRRLTTRRSIKIHLSDLQSTSFSDSTILKTNTSISNTRFQIEHNSLPPVPIHATPHPRHFHRIPCHNIHPENTLPPFIQYIFLDLHSRLLQPAPISSVPPLIHNLQAQHRNHCFPVGKRILRLQRGIRSPTRSLHFALPTLPRSCSESRTRLRHHVEGMEEWDCRRERWMDVSCKGPLGVA